MAAIWEVELTMVQVKTWYRQTTHQAVVEPRPVKEYVTCVTSSLIRYHRSHMTWYARDEAGPGNW